MGLAGTKSASPFPLHNLVIPIAEPCSTCKKKLQKNSVNIMPYGATLFCKWVNNLTGILSILLSDIWLGGIVLLSWYLALVIDLTLAYSKQLNSRLFWHWVSTWYWSGGKLVLSYSSFTSCVFWAQYLQWDTQVAGCDLWIHFNLRAGQSVGWWVNQSEMLPYAGLDPYF